MVTGVFPLQIRSFFLFSIKRVALLPAKPVQYQVMQGFKSSQPSFDVMKALTFPIE